MHPASTTASPSRIVASPNSAFVTKPAPTTPLGATPAVAVPKSARALFFGAGAGAGSGAGSVAATAPTAPAPIAYPVSPYYPQQLQYPMQPQPPPIALAAAATAASGGAAVGMDHITMRGGGGSSDGGGADFDIEPSDFDSFDTPTATTAGTGSAAAAAVAAVSAGIAAYDSAFGNAAGGGADIDAENSAPAHYRAAFENKQPLIATATTAAPKSVSNILSAANFVGLATPPPAAPPVRPVAASSGAGGNGMHDSPPTTPRSHTPVSSAASQLVSPPTRPAVPGSPSIIDSRFASRLQSPRKPKERESVAGTAATKFGLAAAAGAGLNGAINAQAMTRAGPVTPPRSPLKHARARSELASPLRRADSGRFILPAALVLGGSTAAVAGSSALPPTAPNSSASASASSSSAAASAPSIATSSFGATGFGAGLSNNTTTAMPLAASTADSNAYGYTDRFIPSRTGSNIENAYALHDIQSSAAAALASPSNRRNPLTAVANSVLSPTTDSKEEAAATYAALLRNELLGPKSAAGVSSPSALLSPSNRNAYAAGAAASAATGTLLDSDDAAAYLTSPTRTSPSASAAGSGAGARAASAAGVGAGGTRTFKFASPRTQTVGDAPYSSSPLGANSQQLLSSPKKVTRKYPKAPFKVLDAPSLKDDFYLNLVDWSPQNVLAVGLESCVYLWSAITSKVSKLCDLKSLDGGAAVGSDDYVTSVAFTFRGTHIAVGTKSGDVQLWDVIKCKLVRILKGHASRVGALAWNHQSHHLMASGSRDRSIILRDARTSGTISTTAADGSASQTSGTSKLSGHKQEVCGLKWSFDGQQLASGGNDNKLLIWNVHSQSPILRFTEHTAAVKALAWSPHQAGLLVSGGGTADRCIRFWNTLSGSAAAATAAAATAAAAASTTNSANGGLASGPPPLQTIDTGSQVCNIMWSSTVNEIVSTHGYSLNQIICWKYPSMQKLVTLTGHTLRVLYLALSPDGQTIVTGAGDETLRFWNVFPPAKTKSGYQHHSKLFFPQPATDIR